ncbi:MAG: S1 RNA-binding domain-containing protein [Bdellovibrionia bacterium]
MSKKKEDWIATATAQSDDQDIFGDDVSNATTDFQQLLDRKPNLKGLKTGDVIRGEILVVGKEEVFLSTGTPLDGVLPKVQLLDKEKKFNHKVGDVIEAVVVKIHSGTVQLAKKGATAATSADDLQDAFDMELPIEGRVLEAVKGGFRVDVMGQRGFCPVSQMDISFIKETALYVGKKFEFIITKFADRDLVLSRRKVLELQRAENEGEFLQSVQEGDILDGKVMRLEPFGAFVEVAPGVEGLIHISELAWGRVAHPQDVLSVGQEVRAKVLKLDGEGERLKISLSLKQGGSELDPWFSLEEKLPRGKVVSGTVEKKETFGLFVNLMPGIMGLLPKSTWRDHLEPAQFENKKKGDPISVTVVNIDPTARRISLAPPTEGDDDSWKAHAPSKAGLGTFADLLKKKK